MNYLHCYIEEIRDVAKLCYDIFVSGFDGCERTSVVYNKIVAPEKYWLIFPQYVQSECTPSEGCLTNEAIIEDDYILKVMKGINVSGKRVCIDATGFLIPHLLFLIQHLQRQGMKNIDVLYSEPASYIKAENTEFTRSFEMPRPVAGYMASPRNINGNDALIIFTGFTDALVTAVARYHNKAHFKYLFTGFPSLQADMYQQNLIQLSKSNETIGVTNVTRLMAPAYDPFVAANKLQNVVNELMEGENNNLEYIHIAPLSTKPMAIAAALVYLNNPNYPIDIIYPPANTYMCGHTKGIKRTWKYTLEFD